MRHPIPVLTGALLTLTGAGLMGLALREGARDGAPPMLLLICALSALPAGLWAVTASLREVSWPLAALVHLGSNPALVLLAVAVSMTFLGMVLWFLVPGIGWRVAWCSWPGAKWSWLGCSTPCSVPSGSGLPDASMAHSLERDPLRAETPLRERAGQGRDQSHAARPCGSRPTT